MRTALLSISVWGFMASCAVVKAPTGGKRDITPPKVVRTNPDNFSVCFHEKYAYITFDEYIQLKDLYNQLIVSPPLPQTPNVKIKQKSLVIKFPVKLKENTTYAFNFGSAIADINEGNVLDGYQYVVSTGDFIDSLQLTGVILQAETQERQKDITVMLYPDTLNSDSMPYKRRPNYVTKTQKNGVFKLNHIAAGKYKLFALKDESKSYLFSLPDEYIGFADSVIDVAQAKDTLTIQLFKEDYQKQRILKAVSDEFGKMMLVFNRGTKDIRIKDFMGHNLDSLFDLRETSRKKDTLTYWYTQLPADTLKFAVSDGEKVIDTVVVKLSKKIIPEESTSKKNATSKRREEKGIRKITLSIYTGTTEGFNPRETVSLNFAHPIKKFDKEKIRLNPIIHIGKKDSVITGKTIPVIVFSDSSKRKMLIQYPLQDTSKYSLFIAPGAFTDIFGIQNDTLKTKIITKGVSDYGTLAINFNVQANCPQFILQLLDDKNNVVRQQIQAFDGKILFDYLNPGKYRLKVIYDRNHNGQWDTGNYLKKRQPEKILFYTGDITIRSNWDLDITMDATQ